MNCIVCGNPEIDQDMIDAGSVCPQCHHDPVTSRDINVTDKRGATT